MRELQEETNLAIGKYTLAGVFSDSKHYPGVEVEAYTYNMQIADINFEVYEGAGAEAYHPGELKNRADISGIAQSTLKKFGERQWH